MHFLTAARGNLLVRGDRLGHSTRDALVTDLRINHVAISKKVLMKLGREGLAGITLQSNYSAMEGK